MTKREGAAAPDDAARFEPVAGAIVAEKYRVERTLGEGGMGIVVAATHLALEQRVAIKFLLPEGRRSDVAVERFLREARVAAKVRSEYVARVHDVGTLPGGVPYIVMEHLDGADLGQLIARGGPLAVDEACEIALQACEALAEVHAAGVIHRDLKPSNLFVTWRSDGSPAAKLLDFGISKLTFGPDEPSANPALTATATILGSPSYMSPEQLKSTREVDHRTDVWSLGAVLYEALSGKPAFRGETIPQVCAMIASEPPPRLSGARAGIPVPLERAILGCLDKDPDTRLALVDLAAVLAEFAPDRAKPLFERIQAVASAGSSRQRAAPRPTQGDLPVLRLATAERRRTLSAGGKPRRGRRAGTVAALTLALTSAVALGLGAYTGKLRFELVRGATSAPIVSMLTIRSGASSAPAAIASAAAIAPAAASAPASPGAPPDPTPQLPPLPPAPPTEVVASPLPEAPREDPDEPDAASLPAAAALHLAPRGSVVVSGKPTPAKHSGKPVHHLPRPLRHKR